MRHVAAFAPYGAPAYVSPFTRATRPAPLPDVLRDLAHDMHRAEGDIFAARVALEIAEGAFSAAPTPALARLIRRIALDPHRLIGDGIASRLALEVLSRRHGATPEALLIRLSRRLRRPS